MFPQNNTVNHVLVFTSSAVHVAHTLMYTESSSHYSKGSFWAIEGPVFQGLTFIPSCVTAVCVHVCVFVKKSLHSDSSGLTPKHGI